MENSNLNILIEKFLKNDLSSNEVKLLEELAKDPINNEIIKDRIRENIRINKAISNFDPNTALKKFNTLSSTKQFKWSSVFKYAAVLVGITLISAIIFNIINSEQNQGIEALDNLQIVSQDVQLILGNGDVTTIDLASNDSINLGLNGFSAKHQASNISYANLAVNSDKTEESVVYNELKVPYGKKFNLELSDGTDIYLNAGSTIKFPVKFIEGQKREVFIAGEAYFDVTKDPNHPFVVHTGDMAVEVLGTSFNVSNYPEDSNIEVVLEEGAVALSEKESSQTLQLVPGELGSLVKNSPNSLSKKTVNTAIYTGWRNGRFTFRNISFDNIIPKLERQYNVNIVNNNDKLNQEKFYASFDESDIKVILQYFQESFDLKFNVDKNEITIK